MQTRVFGDVGGPAVRFVLKYKQAVSYSRREDLTSEGIERGRDKKGWGGG